MPTAPNYPSIPVPTDDPKALLESVLVLKQTVEMLTGQDIFSGKEAPHVFVQPDAPQAIHTGDMWLCTAKIYSFNVWDGQHWLKIGDIATPLMAEQPYFNLHQFIRRRGGG